MTRDERREYMRRWWAEHPERRREIRRESARRCRERASRCRERSRRKWAAIAAEAAAATADPGPGAAA